MATKKGITTIGTRISNYGHDGSPNFWCVSLNLGKTKKTKHFGEVLASGPKMFFCFLILLEVRQTTESTVFFDFFLHGFFYTSSKNLSKNQKRHVFVVICLTSNKNSFKKQKKSKPKNKHSRKPKKNTSSDLKPKLIQKALVFWFSRGFEQSIVFEFFFENAHAILSQFAFADMTQLVYRK